jgi:DegV family protein with EDD domain
MTVAIITDGAASLPADLAEHEHVTIVPLQVTVAGRDTIGDPRDAGELGRWLAAGVRTSGPSPGQFLAALGECGGTDGTLLLTVARSMSGTYQAATIAAERASGRVQVLDTGTAAGGQGLVVLAAARASAAGLPLGGVAAAASRVADEVRLVAAVPSLTWLLRGGRLASRGPPQSGGGSKRGVRPMFEFRQGRIVPLPPSLSAEAARRRLVECWRRAQVPGARLHLAALHAYAPDEAAGLLGEVTRHADPVTSFIGEFSLAMAAHTGPGVVGLAWWWETC